MASNNNEERWYFTKEQLDNTPSRQCGIEAYKELSYRQQAANFIQDLGQRLKVSQLCINTAIVYMHRFYVFHSFTYFPWHLIASAALFLAAKVEEQPRKLEHVIKIANLCKNPRDTNFDTTSERYLAQSQDLVFNENVLLQTLGFDVAIDHPHTHVVKCCHLVRASKDLAQTSYFMASNSLHLTTMCLQYKPTVVACFCIHLACKWSNWEIPLSNEKKEWFSYVDPTVTAELLQQLTEEFLVIFERCPSRLKEKIKLVGDGQSAHNPSPPLEDEKRIANFAPPEQKDPHSHRSHHLEAKTSKVEDPYKRSQKLSHDASSSSQRDRDKEREYRERKERERMASHSKYPVPLGMSASKHMPPPPHSHHSHLASADVKLKPHGRPPSSSHQSMTRIESKNILRGEVPTKEHREIGKDLCGESANRDVHRDIQMQHSDKDFQKRESVNQRQEIKSNITTETNCDISLNDSRVSFNSDKRPDVPRTSKVSVDSKPQTSKHDFVRKREELKPHAKLETDIKKHLNSELFDKNSSFLENSQKLKSPLASDFNKVIANQTSTPNLKVEPSIFCKNSNLNSLLENSDTKSIQEIADKEIQLPVKRPSLFSPEKSPHKNHAKTPPTFSSNSIETSKFVQPPEKESPKISGSSRRNRTSSNSSEPELRPVMKKIDQVEGFEHLMRDSSIGLKLQVPDIITPITERSEVQPSIAKDMKPPDLIPPFSSTSTFVNTTNTSTNVTTSHPLVNGIETNPTLISNLLKETPTTPHLQAMAVPSQTHLSELPSIIPEQKEKEKEHHHKERKKNKKEKHKHKDKSKEEKEKKKKHKDKDKEKHKHKHDNPPAVEGITTQPIKITIPKDKIQPPESTPTSSGLKIKIPKDRIKTESLENPNQSSPGQLKIRIPKGVINFANDSKKRERDKSSPSGGPPLKIMKSNHGRPSDPKQNGKNSYNKLGHVAEGDSHRLAESKYKESSA